MNKLNNPEIQLTPAAYIRKARLALGLNQKEFGKRVGKEQSLVSRYEREEADPPAGVIMHCMHILERAEGKRKAEIGLDDLIEAIQEKLTAPEKAKARTLLFDLLQTLT